MAHYIVACEETSDRRENFYQSLCCEVVNLYRRRDYESSHRMMEILLTCDDLPLRFRYLFHRILSCREGYDELTHAELALYWAREIHAKKIYGKWFTVYMKKAVKRHKSLLGIHADQVKQTKPKDENDSGIYGEEVLESEGYENDEMTIEEEIEWLKG